MYHTHSHNYPSLEIHHILVVYPFYVDAIPVILRGDCCFHRFAESPRTFHHGGCCSTWYVYRYIHLESTSEIVVPGVPWQARISCTLRDGKHVSTKYISLPLWDPGQSGQFVVRTPAHVLTVRVIFSFGFIRRLFQACLCLLVVLERSLSESSQGDST